MDTFVSVEGNATREPELRYTSSGVAVCTCGIAVNNQWRDQATGEKMESVHFYDVELWRTLAENFSASVSKGTRVMVTGTLKQDTWEQDGQKRSKVLIRATGAGLSARFSTLSAQAAERKERVTSGAPATAEGFDEEPF